MSASIHVATRYSNGAGKVAYILVTTNLSPSELGWLGYWLGGGIVEFLK